MCNIKKIRRLRTPIPHTIIIWTWLHSLIQKKPAFNAKEAIIGRINSYDQFQMQGRTLLKIFFIYYVIDTCSILLLLVLHYIQHIHFWKYIFLLRHNFIAISWRAVFIWNIGNVLSKIFLAFRLIGTLFEMLLPAFFLIVFNSILLYRK